MEQLSLKSVLYGVENQISRKCLIGRNKADVPERRQQLTTVDDEDAALNSRDSTLPGDETRPDD